MSCACVRFRTSERCCHTRAYRFEIQVLFCPVLLQQDQDGFCSFGTCQTEAVDPAEEPVVFSVACPKPTAWPAILGCMDGFLILAFLRLGLAAWLPLTPDEAYYWWWSQHLQAGYLDHPPMVALWIRLGTLLCGSTPLGIRLCGVLASFLASLALWRAGQIWLRVGPGAQAAWLLNATLMFGLGMCLMTPDTPQMFFAALLLWCLAEILRRESTYSVWWWGGAGLCLGGGMESKYTFLLLAVGLGGYVLQSGQWRRVGPWLAAGIAGVSCGPTLWWNALHRWAGFLKQGRRLGHWAPAHALHYLGELLAGQIGLLTPVVGFCVVLGCWQARRKMPLLLWLVLPGAGVFLAHALYAGRVQANWPCVLYPALAMAGALPGRFFRTAVATGLFMGLIVSVQALFHCLPLNAHHDPALRLMAGWDGLARQAETEARAAGAEALVIEDYGLAAIISFYARQHPQALPVVGTDPRWGYLTGLRKVTVRQAAELSEARGALKIGGRHLIRRVLLYSQKRQGDVRDYVLASCGNTLGWQISP
ncbi:glycosyltransferase family 39 protein [Oecophyllibacter saccharovorans]|nr:glycosyltransferase family 39 protein [Oecophyllibacter saccharovorans]